MEDVESERSEALEPLEPLNPHVLDRVCAGLEASPNTPEEIKAFYREAERLRLGP